ncbi:A disintegrin and metalloproteinase with thrombospondin motifs 20 isoform X6 [Pongo pygmaeus]|uniref:A disintegrin and metalloproteinase with thrombospondin motifs 20 isoform X6 n=1 Tax=Pongo pygmaeus TaxID=9600 RepID=UPI00300C2E21
MWVAKWLTGLLYHLSLFITRSWEVHFHPRQETLVRTLTSYEVVIPERVNEFGEVFPQSHHFSRRKRSSEALEPMPFRTHYRFTAYGQLFQLNLTADASFLAASYSEVHLGTPERGAWERDAGPSDLRHCFYRGQVNSQEDYKAVVSLCGGLTGTFKGQDGEYFLEPIMKADGNEYEDGHNKPHLIYRQELNNSFLQTLKYCNVSESQIKKTSLPFQTYSNMNEDVNVMKERVLGHTSKNVPLKDERSQLHSRKKRLVSYPRYIEIMVTADAKVVSAHGSNLQNYILTLMSIVATIYKDPSIGNFIHIVVVKLVMIHHEEEGPVINFDGATTLKNFCSWQQTQNDLDDVHPSHHDTAVLITREDICSSKEKCNMLGLSYLGTICDPLQSCFINEEKGLISAFTIAHELGHTLGVQHDDSPRCKEMKVTQYHVMAPALSFHMSPWSWSNCSRKYVTEFLDTGYGECLLDRPDEEIYNLPSELPGSRYDGNKQCELAFGPGSQMCPHIENICMNLWCTSAEKLHKGCFTQHVPPADGTDCGPGMHCRHGLCVNKETETRPVNGEWGPWEPYSSCSRTCGGGIESATRHCNRPEPRNGGNYCVGRRMKFRSCNTDSCPKGTQDFREKQCSDFNGKHLDISGIPSNVRWLPRYSGIGTKDRCKLYCQIAGTSDFYLLKDMVEDGTPCGTETHDICVQGQCMAAGCDHVLNSSVKIDKCGVCGGDNSSCKTITGVFNSSHYGYNVVVKIPAGATNVDIRQYSYSGQPDDSYLALSDAEGNFLFNGNFLLSTSKKEINVQGTRTVIEYSGSNNAVERINSTNRQEKELILQVLCVGNLYNPDVHYSFNIPLEERSDMFTWDPYGPWEGCTKMCQGLQRRKITCIHKSDHSVVSDKKCDHLPLPSFVTQSCNTDCEIRWHVIGKSECSSQCGQGYRTLDIHCMKYSIHKGQTVQVDDHYCGDQLKPPARELCHGNCVFTRWHYSEWSQCSRSCGGGERSRESYCMNNFGHRLADNECQELSRVTRENCNEFSCPSWAASEWSKCLVTCGKGTKQRQVWCQLNVDHLSDDFCNSSTKPESLSPCELHTCASWQVGPWGPCTTTCGHGYQMRDVKCVNELVSAVLEDTECHEASRPSDRQNCVLTPCSFISKLETASLPTVLIKKMAQWRHGSWTPCSVTCGSGVQQRDVYCRLKGVGQVVEEMCDQSTRPCSQRRCWRQDCVQHKGMERERLNCSTSCERKDSRQRMECTDNQIRQVNEIVYNSSTISLTSKNCRNPPCNYIVVTADSSQCANNCGFSYRQRITYCTKIPSTKKHKLHRLRPIVYQECPVLPSSQVYKCINSCLHLATWKVGKWSKCSVTCGIGIMKRQVKCITKHGLSSDLCLNHLKPGAQKKCYANDCKSFTTCKEIQVKNHIRKDGDYYLNIKGRIIKIYCADMYLENPKEYLTLVQGEENFSEVYGFRLKNPYQCPFNGSRREDCECDNGHLAAGYTVFSKIRIDLTSMQIKITDLLFSKTIFGNAVPFATAGDCYSAFRCPQGQFSINLAGTGMKISSTAKWLAQGSYTSVSIRRSEDGTRFFGKCGGYCGKCLPHMTTGLPIQVI